MLAVLGRRLRGAGASAGRGAGAGDMRPPEAIAGVLGFARRELRVGPVRALAALRTRRSDRDRVSDRPVIPFPTAQVRQPRYGWNMRRLGAVIGAYVVVAALTRLAEAAGLHRCGCNADCWCQRPLLSLFRWVFPYGHR